MTVRRINSLAWILLCVIGMSVLSWSQTERQRYDPALNVRRSKSENGILDFALKQINPSDKDYGEAIADDRTLLVTETIENGFFWSNLVSLGLLGLLFIVVVYQHRYLHRSGWKSAQALDQLEHTLARANGQINEIQKQNQLLSDSLNATREPARTPLGQSQNGIAASSTFVRLRASTGEKKSDSAPRDGEQNSGPNGLGKGTAKAPGNGQIALFNVDGDLVMKLNTQEQQINALREQVNLVRRQLTETERKLRTEQERNRTLKGA